MHAKREYCQDTAMLATDGGKKAPYDVHKQMSMYRCVLRIAPSRGAYAPRLRLAPYSAVMITHPATRRVRTPSGK